MAETKDAAIESAVRIARQVFVGEGWVYGFGHSAAVPSSSELRQNIEEGIAAVVGGSKAYNSGRIVVQRDMIGGSNVSILIEIGNFAPEEPESTDATQGALFDLPKQPPPSAIREGR